MKAQYIFMKLTNYLLLFQYILIINYFSKMSKKDKTQSFTYAKSPNTKLKNSHVSISPDKSEKRYSREPNEYQQVNTKRFLRKSLKKQDVFEPRQYITNQFTYQDVVDLKQVFDHYDSTEMGVLLPNDIKYFLFKESDYKPNKKTVYQIVGQFDLEQTGGISFKDFMTAMSTKPSVNQTRKQISAIFKKYDRTGKNYIDIDDIREVNKHIKQEMDEEQLQLMLKRADSNQDNKISFQDFYAVMVKKFY